MQGEDGNMKYVIEKDYLYKINLETIISERIAIGGLPGKSNTESHGGGGGASLGFGGQGNDDIKGKDPTLGGGGGGGYGAYGTTSGGTYPTYTPHQFGNGNNGANGICIIEW